MGCEVKRSTGVITVINSSALTGEVFGICSMYRLHIQHMVKFS